MIEQQLEQQRKFLKNLLIDIQNYICDCRECDDDYSTDFCSIFSRLLIFLPLFNTQYNVQPSYYENLNCLDINGLLQMTNNSLSIKGKVSNNKYKRLLQYYYYILYVIMVEANPDNLDLFNKNVIERCIDDCVKRCVEIGFDDNGEPSFMATINTQFNYAMVEPIDTELNYEFELVATNQSGSIGFKFPNNYKIINGTFKIFSNGDFVNEDLNKWNMNQVNNMKVYTYTAENTIDEYIPIGSSQRYKLQLKRIA